jgi:two-component system response regulator (stage 0 sporulation protein F)
MARLLIVDDEEDVREFAANFFRKRKIDVITAANGEEAIALVEKENPQLVLLDVKMTGIDGIETLRLIREKNKNIKVIMVTGRKPEEEDILSRCKQLGVLDYIQKPLDLNQLKNIVLGVLEKPADL